MFHELLALDGLVRDVQGWIVGPHTLERTRDLLGRPLQQREHHAPGDALHMQLGSGRAASRRLVQRACAGADA
jgi:hypothetical protein